MATIETSETSELTLCRISLRDAQRLGMAAHAAGGWIATAPVCRYAADVVLGAPSYAPELIALLPADWSEGRPLSAPKAEEMATHLERAVSYSDDADTAADFAARIRAVRS